MLRAVVCGVAVAAGLLGPAPADAGNLLMFSGFDLWRDGQFSHAGVVWTPRRDGSGPRLKLLLGGGTYRYDAAAWPVLGVQGLAAILPGWRVRRGALTVTAYAGLDLQYHLLLPDDPENRLRGRHAGVRLATDLWYQPRPHLMATGWLGVTTIGWGHSARAALGWRVVDRAWIGPEVQALGDSRSHQWRAGLHVTGVAIRGTTLSLGAGYATDTDRRTGPYVRFGLTMRR